MQQAIPLSLEEHSSFLALWQQSPILLFARLLTITHPNTTMGCHSLNLTNLAPLACTHLVLRSLQRTHCFCRRKRHLSHIKLAVTGSHMKQLQGEHPYEKPADAWLKSWWKLVILYDLFLLSHQSRDSQACSIRRWCFHWGTHLYLFTIKIQCCIHAISLNSPTSHLGGSSFGDNCEAVHCHILWWDSWQKQLIPQAGRRVWCLLYEANIFS